MYPATWGLGAAAARAESSDKASVFLANMLGLDAEMLMGNNRGASKIYIPSPFWLQRLAVPQYAIIVAHGWILKKLCAMIS